MFSLGRPSLQTVDSGGKAGSVNFLVRVITLILLLLCRDGIGRYNSIMACLDGGVAFIETNHRVKVESPNIGVEVNISQRLLTEHKL